MRPCEFPSNVEADHAPKGWLLLDLDGVIIRWANAHTPNATDQGAMLATIAKAKDAGIGIAVLTNRPPGAMPAIAYELGVSTGTWVTESGGSLYDVLAHKACVSRQWVSFLPRIQALRNVLTQQLRVSDAPVSFDEAQFEPGLGFVKTVLVPPRHISPDAFANDVVAPILAESGFDQWFDVTAGKAVDIDPVGLSKEQGMGTLLSVNGIDPTKTPALWIADHDRDIAAGTTLMRRGGRVSCVGNASCGYRAFVQSSGGIVAPSETNYHSSVTHIVEMFMKSL